MVKQLLDSHRIQGEIEGKIPRSFIFIDEAKEIKDSRSIKLTSADGRKYGLCAVLASQRDAEISDEALANSSTKVVLPVDQSEVKRVARRFRFAENLVAQLQPMEALVRMGTEGRSWQSPAHPIVSLCRYRLREQYNLYCFQKYHDR